MKVTVERLADTEVKLAVEVEVTQVSEAFKEAYRRLVKKVNIPGFRRGKAPRAVLERFLGREALQSEAADVLVHRGYADAVKESGIHPVDQAQIAETDDVEEDRPWHFEATVTVKPVVEAGDYNSLRSPLEPVSVADEELEHELEELRKLRGQLVPSEEADPESYVLVDVVTTAPDGSLVEDTKESLWNLGSGGPLTVREALYGTKAGDIREVDWIPPGAEENFHSRIAIREVKRVELPALDDEFARNLGGFPGLQELRSDVAKALRQNKETEAKKAHRDAILDRLREGNKASIPEVMVRNRIEWIVRETEHDLNHNHLTLERFLAERGQSEEQWRVELQPVAEAQLLNELILEAIAKQEGFQVLPGEVEERAKRVFGSKPHQLSTGEREILTEELLQEKALAFLTEPPDEKE